MLGVGLDMPWGQGFIARPGGDHVAPHVQRFLQGQAWNHAFLSWQPRSRARLRLADYVPAWDQAMETLAHVPIKALHHTALNLAAARAPRAELLDFTNALLDRYGLAWVNEDLGFWAVGGRPLPYPLPPLLTDDGVAACVRNARLVDDALIAPLRVEFPGFSQGWSLTAGGLDAYDAFRLVVEHADVECTLDVGHLLSWRWLCGHRGPDLLDGLERLPLHHTVELHLSGVDIDGDTFVDAHHGVLIEEQFALMERLLERCPHVRFVTFEDPAIAQDGSLDATNVASLARLSRLTPQRPGRRLQRTPRPLPNIDTRPVAEHERHLDHAFRGLSSPLAGDQADGIADQLRTMVRTRRALGVPSLQKRFAPLFEAVDGDQLVRDFLASDHYARWVELPTDEPGLPLEEAFARFAMTAGFDQALVQRLRCAALIRALGVDPQPAFRVPEDVLGQPGRWMMLRAEGAQTILHAAIDGRIIEGPLPALAVDLIREEHGGNRVLAPVDRVAPVRRRLQDLQLLSS